MARLSMWSFSTSLGTLITTCTIRSSRLLTPIITGKNGRSWWVISQSWRSSTCNAKTKDQRELYGVSETRMDLKWNDSQPIYRQLRDRVIAMILDGVLKEGDPLPSVRIVAAEYRVNPLTVLKSYQELVDEELVEKRR